MRIALVILHADPARGGAERYTIDLARALSAGGHDVSLLASSFVDTDAAAARRLISARGATRRGRYVGFLNALDAHLECESYDIVHAMLPVRRCDIYHPHAGIAAEAIATGHLKHRTSAGRGLARIGNTLNFRRRAFAAIEREMMTSNRPPILLCLSQYVKGVARKHYPSAEPLLETLFNAIDTVKFDPTARPTAGVEIRQRVGIPPEAVVALMIAHDYERKGLRETCLAMAQILRSRRQMHLVVVGKQDASGFVPRDLDRGPLHFAGATTDPYAFYRAADFFVLPTRHDPCSLVVLEALAMGLPVISTVFNGACEIMTTGKHGFVLPNPTDVSALTCAMESLLDADRRRAMAAECLELRPALAYQRHIDELVGIYRKVISRPSHR